MNLFRISHDQPQDYDTYDSAVVIAESAKEAVKIHPDGRKDWDGKTEDYDSWVASSKVKAVYLGEAKEGSERGVVVASFNAG